MTPRALLDGVAVVAFALAAAFFVAAAVMARNRSAQRLSTALAGCVLVVFGASLALMDFVGRGEGIDQSSGNLQGGILEITLVGAALLGGALGIRHWFRKRLMRSRLSEGEGKEARTENGSS